jgi:hypothetical protein
MPDQLPLPKRNPISISVGIGSLYSSEVMITS